MNSFTRKDKDIKEVLDIGHYHLAEEIECIRIIELDPGHKRLKWVSAGKNNVKECISITEEESHKILEDLSEGKYPEPHLLEITQLCDYNDTSGVSLYKWSLGTSLKGKRIKYKGKLYYIPEDLCKDTENS